MPSPWDVGGSGMRRESQFPGPSPHPRPQPCVLILRCVVVLVEAMRTGAFLPEPAPGQAWIGTSAELWEWPWGLGAVGASPGQGGKGHRPSLSRGGLVLSLHSVQCGLTGSWDRLSGN